MPAIHSTFSMADFSWISGWCDWKSGTFIAKYKERSSPCRSSTTCHWITEVCPGHVLLDFVCIGILICLFLSLRYNVERKFLNILTSGYSSCCSESQREAALLLGQFAATDSDCKVHWSFSIYGYFIFTL